MTDDWLGRDDDGDGIPNAIDADPNIRATGAGATIEEDPGSIPADAPPAGNTTGPDDQPRPAKDEPARMPMPAAPEAPPAGADQAALTEYQVKLREYSRLMDMYSKVIQLEHEIERGIVQNFRV